MDRQKLFWPILALLLLAGCAATPTPAPPTGTPPPTASSTPAPATAQPLAQPYPYTTPLPPPTPTQLDGAFSREIEFLGTPVPCRRCAPYRANGGEWRLAFDRGVFRVTHSLTNFQGIGSFTIDGNRLNLFNDPNCHLDVGVYTWEKDGRMLRLTEVADPCAFGLRAKNLTGDTWLLQADGDGSVITPCEPPNHEAAITGHWAAPAGCQN